MGTEESNHSEFFDDRTISGNLVAPALGLAIIVLLAFGAWALGMNDHGELSRCAAIHSDEPRLACYDELSAPRQPARGALGRLHH